MTTIDIFEETSSIKVMIIQREENFTFAGSNVTLRYIDNSNPILCEKSEI